MSEKTYFRDKVVWITGASSGLGRTIAVGCARLGARVIASARRTERLDELKAALKAEGHDIEVLPLDLAEQASLEEAVEKAEGMHGRIDVLVNNAGISMRSLVADIDFAVIRRLTEVNYLGTVALTQLVLKKMRIRHTGHVVVVSSVMGKFASPLRSAYCGSKFALHGFFDAYAAESRADGVTVSFIIPGRLRTEISMHALQGDGSEQAKMDPALGRAADPARYVHRILSAIARRKYECYVGCGLLLRTGVIVTRLFPGIVRSVVQRVRVT